MHVIGGVTQPAKDFAFAQFSGAQALEVALDPSGSVPSAEWRGTNYERNLRRDSQEDLLARRDS